MDMEELFRALLKDASTLLMEELTANEELAELVRVLLVFAGCDLFFDPPPPPQALSPITNTATHRLRVNPRIQASNGKPVLHQLI